MIRQAISCDICGAEMQHTNHWFVAIENSGELRVSGLGARGRGHGGAKHLCGQTCLHKLLDEFVVRTLPARSASVEKHAQPTTQRNAGRRIATQSSPKPSRTVETSTPEVQPACIDDFESSARLITTLELPIAGGVFPVPADAASIATQTWRTEAWKREREREREQSQSEHRSKPLSRRRSMG